MNPYLEQPREVSIETLALCNARCTFCPYPTLERKGTEMSMSLIERLIGEMSEWQAPFFFSPFKVNEPFLDKRVIGICRHVNQQAPLAKLRLFTNGTPLTEKLIGQVAALENVEHLWVSLNSHDAEEYQRVMGLDLLRTLVKLDSLDVAIHYGRFPHKVVVSRVASDNGQDNIDFIRFVRRRWNHFEPVIIKRDGWLGYVAPTDTRVPDRPCARWEELSIMADGRAALCCMDGTGEYAYGNVNQSTLLELYNLPSLRQRREERWSRKRVGPCNRCTY